MNGPLRQVTVLSGKGGTGKTTLTGSFAFYAKDAIIADGDVDASNLALILGGNVASTSIFCGSQKASIDPIRCTKCGRCAPFCNFHAIQDFTVDTMACEGCGVCRLICSEGAVKLEAAVNGEIFVRRTPFGTLIDSEMLPGEPNSGKLVARVRALALEQAKLEHSELVLVDGPPGTGCPVISSLTGVDMAIVMTEPTVSGRHDLVRVIELARHFGIPCAIIINKFDLNPSIADELENECHKIGVRVLGRVPYDEEVGEAIVNGQPLPVHSPDSMAAKALGSIWVAFQEMVKELPKKGTIPIE